MFGNQINFNRREWFFRFKNWHLRYDKNLQPLTIRKTLNMDISGHTWYQISSYSIYQVTSSEYSQIIKRPKISPIPLQNIWDALPSFLNYWIYWYHQIHSLPIFVGKDRLFQTKRKANWKLIIKKWKLENRWWSLNRVEIYSHPLNKRKDCSWLIVSIDIRSVTYISRQLPIIPWDNLASLTRSKNIQKASWVCQILKTRWILFGSNIRKACLIYVTKKNGNQRQEC